MQDLKGAVAVVTGAGSGIGYALARGAQARGAKLVISDIREDALADAKAKLADGGEVLAMRGDVADAGDIEALASAAVDRFGKVNLLFNNAGVFASGVAWKTSLEEYEWVINVNQKSVIHGIRAFVPRMIAQGDPCHVTTISSGAGITVNPGFATYSMTKHAVLALTEALYLDLKAQAVDTIGVTVVMPGVIQSKIMFPEKTGPEGLQDELKSRLANPALGALEAFMRQAVDTGLPADALADLVYGAIAKGDLYVLPNFTDEASQAIAQGIGLGRATGENAYPRVMQGLFSQLQQAPQ